MTNALLEEHYRVRDDLCRALAADLIGPREPDEVLDEPPLDRYVTGILYPLLEDSRLADEAVEEVSDDDGDAASDPAVAMSNVHYPSSAGVTFAVDSAVDSLRVTAEAARYLPEDEGRWRRQPVGPVEAQVRLGVTESQRIDLGEDGLRLYVRSRPPADGARSVTVVLLNTQVGRPGHKDETAFFQVAFRVSGEGAAFVARQRRLGVRDEDLVANELLYRDRPEFAIGHGCAAEWEQDEADPRRARTVSAGFFPWHDVPIVVSNPEIEDDGLHFETLAAASPHDLVAALEAFAAGYSHWIEERRRTLPALGPPHRQTAEAHLRECELAQGRIVTGIELLRGDADARRAFQLANRAMVDQMNRRSTTGGEEAGEKAPRWYPFQLAFVLLSMPSIVDPSHPDREVVELLWFPTGGGKTEAYLALFAFAVFHRRLARAGAGGVTAIMRYTLRLLTAQQFERAARVVCACERIRRQEGDLGSTPVSIGLFVGSGSTPNRLDEARDALNSLRAHQRVATRNPVQLHACPWCEEPLDASNYALRESPRRVQIECRNAACAFAHGLPVYVVDEDLYRERPTLVIGTVDKFAALPWRPEVGNLFNLDHPDEPPPSLVIQDELHLISGPLGTMTGLYETVIDALASEAGEPAKVIASTATIRRAKQQSVALFGRGMRQFPPPGVDPDDSWFATVAPGSSRGPRRYLGLMAPGVSHATLMIRVYASLLHAAGSHDRDAAVDPYWTLIGYFNSLRVLGAARMQVQDDVQDQLRTAAGGGDPVRSTETVELTSRVDSSEIPERLKQLEKKLPAQRPLDVVLATNMISVGVDVDRLGLMAMMGQPQAAAEYIQATSRVGRSHPGLVVTLYNAARSRDRSHFEGFTAFHEALYRSVEPTSVTPYSPRARDRGLHAVLIALARLRIEGLRENERAAAVAEHRRELDGVAATILERVRAVDPEQLDATAAQLEAIVERWLRLAELHPGLVYESHSGAEPALMVAAAPELETGDELATMWSMRDVDAESNLFFAGRRR